MAESKKKQMTPGLAEAANSNVRVSGMPRGGDGAGQHEGLLAKSTPEMARRLACGEGLDKVSRDFGIPVYMLSDWYDRLRKDVSDYGKRLWKCYQSFSIEDLGEHDIAYLFLEGISLQLRPGQLRRAALAAWGITDKGRRVLLGIMGGHKQNSEHVRAFFKDMRSRGLRDPLLVVFDCPSDIAKVVDVCFPRSARQLCLAHRERKLAAVLPDAVCKEFVSRASKAYRATSPESTVSLVKGIVKDFGDKYPSVVEFFYSDLDACFAYRYLPEAHRQIIVEADLFEGIVMEDMRKVGVVPEAFGASPTRKLLLAAMIKASNDWQPIEITDTEREQMCAFRERLDRKYEARARSGSPERSPE